VRGLDTIPGVPPGSFGLISKVHHAAIDGVSGVELTTILNHLDPTEEPPEPEQPWAGENDPQPSVLLANATRNNVVRPMHFARVVGRTVPAVGRVADGVRQQQLAARPMLGASARTRFNAPVGPHRVFDGCSFPFPSFKPIREAVPGTTVNDVVLAIVGGAMRRFLEDAGELPDEPLIAMAPISVRTQGQMGTQGNQVSMMLVSLATDVAKPIDRLRAVYASTVNSKELANAVGAKTLTDYSEFIPSAVAGLAARLYTRTGLANRHNPMFNTVVTNIPGPQVPLFFCGAEMVAYYGLGPVFDGMGIIHPVLSYNGRLTISFTSTTEMLPDPAAYATCPRDSFDELVRAARRSTKAGGSKKKAS
jgi:WS/DGAT/MGAT family acyltransferase